ncbi:MAG: TonB-dependent receptor plug domain-containing protein [Vicinamibacterales bacterium]
MGKRTFICRALLVCVPVILTWAPAAAAAQDVDSLFMRPLDELMKVEVMSVGKKEQRVVDSAAAVYVITSDEIRRSGLTTVPDLLRLVPGVTVARIDASKWAVSVRGFTNRFANKLLVMIDGRSLYSRMFSGVFWDTLGVPVQEIERIEVIRGPGASLWGANAVNGVINIVTRSATGKPGTSLTAGTGIDDRWSVGAAHGRSVGTAAVRLFGHASERAGTGDFDQWRQAAGGLRVQRGIGSRAHFTLDANGAHSDAGQRSLLFRSIETPSIVPEDVRAVTTSWSTVARFVRPTRQGGEWQIIATQEGMHRHEPHFFDYSRHISDIGWQHRMSGLGPHDLIWGGGVRYLLDDAVSEGPALSIAEPKFAETLFNSFLHDEISITSDVKLTVGTKIEHTAVTGWNAQPTVRGWWSADGTTAVWGAVSRALRTPSWTDTDVRFHADADTSMGPLPVVFGFVGNPDAEQEKLTAYEAGVRTTVADRVAVDVSGFYNHYTDLLVSQLQQPQFELSPFAPHLLVAATPRNVLDAGTAGVEAVAVATLMPRWHLTGTFQVFRLTDLRGENSSDDTSFIDGQTPQFQWSLRSSWSRRAFEYDFSLFKASSLTTPVVPGRLRADARISRRLNDGLEIALTGQNLLQARRPESVVADLVAPTDVPRAISLRAIWHLGGTARP